MKLPVKSLLLLTLFSAPAAYADEVYRSTMPDGRVMYGESPMPGAKSVRKVQAPPSGVVVVTPADKARAQTIVPHQGGVSVVPQEQRPPYERAQAGSGATYGTGPGELPKKPY